MAKVKRMMFGGAAKAVTGALDSVKKAVAAKAAPMKSGPTNPNAVRPTSSPVKGQGVTGGPRPGLTNPNAVRPAAPKQFMSDALRKGTMAPPKTGLGQAAPKQFMSDALRKGTMGAAMGAGRALGMGKKKGGAVKKKATKK